MRRVPSFSSRPGFPSGLQVLLVEADRRTREKVHKQLSQLSYVGTCCTDTSEAAKVLASRPNHFDLVLAEARAVAEESPAFVTALDGLPLVLMSEGGSATEVLKSIELGAVEYIEKPLSLLKLRNIWQHVVRKMMQGNHPEESNGKLLDNKMSVDSYENMPVMPSSPSTPSNLSSGVDHDFIVVDDSLKSFKLCETLSSSSHSDPSDIFLPDLAACADSDSVPCPFPAADNIHLTAPPYKKPRRNKDSSSAIAAAAPLSSRPPLAIRPAPPTFSMIQSPVMNMTPSQWGVTQSMPGYVWGTPMAGSQVMETPSAWQGQSGVGCSSMPVRDLMRCQSAGGDYSLPSLMSDSSCSTICPDLDRSFSLNISSPNSVLEDPPAVGSLFSSEHSDSQHSSVPPIGLQLRKSESFLDLINEHLQKGQ